MPSRPHRTHFGRTTIVGYTTANASNNFRAVVGPFERPDTNASSCLRRCSSNSGPRAGPQGSRVTITATVVASLSGNRERTKSTT